MKSVKSGLLGGVRTLSLLEQVQQSANRPCLAKKPLVTVSHEAIGRPLVRRNLCGVVRPKIFAEFLRCMRINLLAATISPDASRLMANRDKKIRRGNQTPG